MRKIQKGNRETSLHERGPEKPESKPKGNKPEENKPEENKLEENKLGGNKLGGKRVQESGVKDAVFGVAYLILVDLIVRNSPKLAAPMYGKFLAERYHYSVSEVFVLLGVFFSWVVRLYRPPHRSHFSIIPSLVSIQPLMIRMTFYFSTKFGPVIGPLVSLSGAYMCIFLTSYAKLGWMSVQVSVPLILGYYFLRMKYGELIELLSVPSCSAITLVSCLYYATEIVQSYIYNKRARRKILGNVTPMQKILYSLGIILVSCVVNHVVGPLQCSWVPESKFLSRLPLKVAKGNIQVLKGKESNTGYISVVRYKEGGDKRLLMRCDHSILGGVYENKSMQSVYPFMHYMEFIEYIKDTPVSPKVLQIGVGVGISTKGLSERGEVDLVEVDPMVYKYAREFFSLPTLDSVYIKDGREFLEECPDSKYDFILHDVFTGGIVPKYLFSIESLAEMRRSMKEEGILVVNYFGTIDSKATASVFFTLATIFSEIKVFLESSNVSELGEAYNIVFFAANRSIEFDLPDRDERRSPAYNHALSTFKNSGVEIDEHVAKWCNIKRAESIVRRQPNYKCPVITDENNPLAHLQYRSAESHWRIMDSILPLEFWMV